MKRITVVAAIAALFLLASCEIGTIVTGQDIAGRVYHAETSDFLEDATVKAYDSSGYLMATDATDYLGRYRLQNLATGYGNRVSFEKAGFMPAEFSDVTIFDNNTVYLDASLSPVPESTLWQIQLTWADASLDLDTHLTGPMASFGRFHVYPAAMKYPSGDTVPEVFIDIDDRGAYREENAYILTQRSGEYRYYVHNYSALDASTSYPSSALSSSGATVRLYRDGVFQGQYSIPAGKGGNCWNVLTISGGFYFTVNTVDYWSDPTQPRSLSSQPAKVDTERLKAVIGAKLVR